MPTKPSPPHRAPRQREARLLVCVIASALIVGCAALERTPPSVVARVPAPGSTDVWIGAPVSVRFSARIDPSSADGVSMTTEDGSAVEVAWSWSADGRTLTGHIIGRPPVPTTLTLDLPASLTGTNGVAVSLPEDLHVWTVPPWHTIGEPVRTPTGRSMSHPSVAIGADGSILLAAYVISDDPTQVSAARWDPVAASWAFLGDRVGTLEPFNGREPSAAFDADGVPVVSWREHVGDRRDVFVARWSDAARAWSELGGGPVVVEPSVGTEPYPLLEASLVVDPFGTLTLVSVVDNAGERPTGIHTYDPSTDTWAWRPPSFRVDVGAPSSARAPALAFHLDGRPVVMHGQNVTGQDNPVFVATRDVGAPAWTLLGTETLTTPGWSSRPTVDVVVSHDGTITAAWIEGSGGSNPDTLRLARFDSTTNEWSALPTPVAAGQSVSRALDPVRLAVDANGRVVIAWAADFTPAVGEDGRRWTHVHRLSSDGATWEQLGPSLHVPSIAPDASRPSLALDATGAPIVAFQATGVAEFPAIVRRWNGP